MDAHSGAASGSESNSNPVSTNSAPDDFVPIAPAPAVTPTLYFSPANPFDLTNVIKRSLSSIGRPTVHSGPLEHQLAPAIQQGNYRHRPADRLSNTLEQLLTTNDETHQHKPTATPSLGLTDDLYNSQISPRDESPKNNDNATSVDGTTIKDTSVVSENLKIGLILGGVLMAVFGYILLVCLRNRYEDRREAAEREAAEEIDLEACDSPGGDIIYTPPSDTSEDMEESNNHKNPFADLERPDPTHKPWIQTRTRALSAPETYSYSYTASGSLTPSSLSLSDYSESLPDLPTTMKKKPSWPTRLWKAITSLTHDPYDDLPIVYHTEPTGRAEDVEIRWLAPGEQRRLRGPCHGSVEMAKWRERFVIYYKGQVV
jgi:8-oxo-dGTP pyrophosphatase MutT (NUDIX family)